MPPMPNQANTAPMNPAPPRSRSRATKAVVGVVVVASLVGGALAIAGARSNGHGGATPVATGTTAPGSTAAPTAAAAGAEPSVCGGVPGTSVMADGMVMAPVLHRAADAADRAAAQRLVASVQTGLVKYTSLSAATAAGYVPATKPTGYVVHYADWAVVRAGDVLDPNRPSSLVYANTVSGPVLLGAMFLGPAPCQPGPDVAGPLTQWHAHANLCLSATHEVVGESNGSGQCAVGTHNTNTYFMMHVWIAPSLAHSYQFEAHVPRAAYAAIIRTGRG